MQFDPENTVVKLCAKGIELEAAENPGEAREKFLQAWNESVTDFEKFTAAHYVARHQPSVEDKLRWDQTALEFALKTKEDSVQTYYPSLYLNIGKCFEELEDFDKALENYKTAHSYIKYLPADGYGKMIQSGIEKGMERIYLKQSPAK